MLSGARLLTLSTSTQKLSNETEDDSSIRPAGRLQQLSKLTCGNILGFVKKEGMKDLDESYAVCKICSATVKYSGERGKFKSACNKKSRGRDGTAG